jgi:hypothetical protein
MTCQPETVGCVHPVTKGTGMNTLPATTGRRDPATTEHLERRLARVTDRCAAAGVPVRTIGVGPFTRHPFVFEQGGSNWVVLPLSAPTQW